MVFKYFQTYSLLNSNRNFWDFGLSGLQFIMQLQSIAFLSLHPSFKTSKYPTKILKTYRASALSSPSTLTLEILWNWVLPTVKILDLRLKICLLIILIISTESKKLPYIHMQTQLQRTRDTMQPVTWEPKWTKYNAMAWKCYYFRWPHTEGPCEKD